MKSIKEWWSGLFGPKKLTEPLPKEVINVGKANLLVTYLNANNKACKEEVSFVGTRYSETYNRPAEYKVNQWLMESVKYGVLTIDDGRRLIPRERVREIYVAYEDYEVEVEPR